MSGLAERSCLPCRGGTPPLSGEETESLLKELRGWRIVGDHHLAKEYEFADFRAPLALVNRIAETAESEGHHPDIEFGWGYVRLKIYTHAIDGLSESDFILAAKIDALEDSAPARADS